MSINRHLLISAMSAAMALATTTAQAHGAADLQAKEKCYGVSAAGKNDCAAADGAHYCAGLAVDDNNPNAWQFVAKGSCEQMNGSLTPPPKG